MRYVKKVKSGKRSDRSKSGSSAEGISLVEQWSKGWSRDEAVEVAGKVAVARYPGEDLPDVRVTRYPGDVP